MKNELLRNLPSVDAILRDETFQPLLEKYPRGMAAACVREAVNDLRRKIINDEAGRCGAMHVTVEAITADVEQRLREISRPSICRAINATGVLLHTGLGRAVWPSCVVDDIHDALKGYVTLAADRRTGKRCERDAKVSGILCELTGAEAAIVVNNNAAATMLVLAALAAQKEVIVSRGQLIEIGGSFRLPEVMAQSGCKLVEVGSTNRTHLRDYTGAITENTAAIFRAHPSNYRIVGFTGSVEVGELAQLARDSGLAMVDDLGAGALVDLEDYGLPHEPTVQNSIQAGADLVLFSADKLIGAAQGGIIVGKKEFVEKCSRHPLYRAFRADKSSLMVLERTLMLFRDREKLNREHPLYAMLSTPVDELRRRAELLCDAIIESCGAVTAEVVEAEGYLGSGSVPMEKLADFAVAVSAGDMPADALATRLRTCEQAIFGRVSESRVLLNVRTLLPGEVAKIAVAFESIGSGE